MMKYVMGVLLFSSVAAAQDGQLDSATRARVIDRAVIELHATYVFPEVAKKMEEAVRERLRKGEYDEIAEPETFASTLTRHFQEVSKDKHLRVRYAIGGAPPGPAPQDREARRRQLLANNCGFVTSEIQPGKVGYVKFNMFASPDFCADAASKAMNAVADADALIIDLRENGGGDPAMVAYVSSYLFDKRTHLNDIWERRSNETREFWTRNVPGKKFGGTKPVYVLTSSYTFSGAEEFSYNLKSLKRATIVGEQTGGGAHPTRGIPIGDRFMIGVPFARSINPITKTNWEGTGVTPDVRVPAAEALETTRRLIESSARP